MPATILPVCKQMLPKMSSIIGRDIKSQMHYVSRQPCLLHYGDHYNPCFLIVPPCISLRWCPDVVTIFLIYLSIHISTVKHPKQNKWFEKWWNQLSMLPSTKTLLYDAFACDFGLRCSFFRFLCKITHSFACKTSRIVAEVLQSIETIMHGWSVSTSSQSALFRPKTFSCQMVVEYFVIFRTPYNTGLHIIPDIKLNLNVKQCVYYIT